MVQISRCIQLSKLCLVNFLPGGKCCFDIREITRKTENKEFVILNDNYSHDKNIIFFFQYHDTLRCCYRSVFSPYRVKKYGPITSTASSRGQPDNESDRRGLVSGPGPIMRHQCNLTNKGSDLKIKVSVLKSCPWLAI